MKAPSSICFKWLAPDCQCLWSAHRGSVNSLLVFWLLFAIKPFALFHRDVFFIIRGPLCELNIYLLFGFGAVSEFRASFRRSKTSLAPHPIPLSSPSNSLLIVPKLFFCCNSSLFVRLWFNKWRLFCHYLFLISPYLGASGGLCCVIMTFSGYIHLYLFNYSLGIRNFFTYN